MRERKPSKEKLEYIGEHVLNCIQELRIADKAVTEFTLSKKEWRQAHGARAYIDDKTALMDERKEAYNRLLNVIAERLEDIEQQTVIHYITNPHTKR